MNDPYKMASLLLNEMRDACITHATAKGWSLLLIIRPRVDFWKEASWWPKMIDFIREYPIDESVFDTWDAFSKEHTGVDTSINAVETFKMYAIGYLGFQILRA
jgi:hypothetical protein